MFSAAEDGPETLQVECSMQQMVDFIAPCKVALPVGSGSSAVQGDGSTQLLELVLQPLLLG